MRTVVLASDYPVEELDTIWLDSHSRTSVRLARILAAEKWGIAPQWRPLTDYSFGAGAAAGTHGTIPRRKQPRQAVRPELELELELELEPSPAPASPAIS